MKINKHKLSGALLILGMVFLVIGLAMRHTAYSWAAFILVLLALVLSGRWLRFGKK